MVNTAFGKQFHRTGAVNLLRQFGEPITYFKAGGTTARAITAMVARDGPEVISESGNTPGQVIIVRVRNDANSGISSEEIDTGLDVIEIPLRVGETPTRLSILRLINAQDNAGMTRFVVG